jgi:hypothetical protein
MEGCFEENCAHMYKDIRKVWYEYPYWVELPDRIVEHCRCGEHNRIWSMTAFMKVWNGRPRRAK